MSSHGWIDGMVWIPEQNSRVGTGFAHAASYSRDASTEGKSGQAAGLVWTWSLGVDQVMNLINHNHLLALIIDFSNFFINITTVSFQIMLTIDSKVFM